MAIRTVFHLLFATAVFILPSSVSGTFNRCPGTERCGLFGFFVLMHDGSPGTNSCEEYCVFFQNATLQCGSCGLGAAEQPTPSPIDPLPTVPVNSQYDISMSLVDIPSSDRSLFTDAAQRWESIVIGDLSNIARSSLRYDLDSGCSVPVTIDDLYICARYSDIDGLNNVLGSAGPYDRRSGNSLTVTGQMEFDVADIATLKSQGNFASVILHEMGHILGIGTLWETTGVTGTDRQNCPYRGPKANAEYTAISGCSVVPTELDGSEGTRCGHWDEVCMGNELMTGFLDAGNNPLSRISIASLEDIGYEVDYRNVDSYTANDLNPNCVCRRRRTLLDMMHGETHQLGLRLPGTQRRKLSDELFEIAMSYGKEELAKRQKAPASILSIFESLNGDTSKTAVQFAANDVVAVFVMEDGVFYDVVVRSEN